MRTKLSLVALSLLSLLAASSLASAEIPRATVAAASLPGCAEGAQVPAPAEFNPAPISLYTGICGPCSSYECAGRNVGVFCSNFITGPGWCIPPTSNVCPTGPVDDSNWACQCATEYL